VRRLRRHGSRSPAAGEEPPALHRAALHRARGPLSVDRGSRDVPIHRARAGHTPSRRAAHGGRQSGASTRADRGTRRRLRGRRADRRHDHPRSEATTAVLRAPGQGLRARGGHHIIRRSRVWIVIGAIVCAALVGLLLDVTGSVTAQRPGDGQAPRFQVDPWWPKPLPNRWLMGQAAGVAVDRHDHIWVIQRPKTLTDDEKGATLTPPRSLCCAPAPPVLEFDVEGSLLQSWGGPGPDHGWPANEHGIYVDHQDTVWLAGNGQKDGQIFKFTRTGKHLLTIGAPHVVGDDTDTKHLNRPAG